jgi:hypothetical protein
MGAIEALAAAKAAGVKLTLDGDGIVLETETPPLDAAVVELLKSSKPDLIRILEMRAAAKAASLSAPPPDCGYLWPVAGIQRWTERDEFGVEMTHAQLRHGEPQSRWALAMFGLKRFVAQGWADQCTLLGWTKEELFRVPEFWSQIHLTGAALLIGDPRVIAVTADNIVIEAKAGAQLRFRRLGPEHLA